MSSKQSGEADSIEKCDTHKSLDLLDENSLLSARLIKQEPASSDPIMRRSSRLLIENSNGLSEEYMAMTKACIHDHDYYSTERKEPVPPRDQAPPSSQVRDSGIKRGDYDIRGNDIKIGTPFTKSRTCVRRIVRKSTIVTSNAAKKGVAMKSGGSKSNDDIIGILSIRDNDEGSKMPSPRPSITPFPPVERNFRRNCDSTIGREEKKIEQNDNFTDFQSSIERSTLCDKSADSAYNSLTCSSTSQTRPYSTSRPPSGGKRSASGGITSSSSSDLSSDECSDVDRLIHNAALIKRYTDDSGSEVVPKDNQDNNKTCDESQLPARSSPPKLRLARKVMKQLTKSEDNVVPLDDSKLQYLPVPPPRKPKRGRNFRSVPMRLRALPTSFWEEPNQTSGAIYTILPPVQPLLHQSEESDIGDIAPVAPMTEKSCRVASSPTTIDHTNYHPIIKAGDTDLLLRLFDQVEPVAKSSGIRKKRGRAKRPAYSTMPSRRVCSQNPCIIDSITEKLFPKLSLDNRQTLASLTRSQSRRTPVEIIGQDVKLSSAGKGIIENDEFTLHYRDDDIMLSGINSLNESRLSTESSPMLLERPSRIFPQLAPNKDYSQLLSELTAVL